MTTPQTTSDSAARAVYVKITNRKVARTVEAIPDEVNVDYDAHGNIVGAEFLGVFIYPGGRWIVTRQEEEQQ